MNQSFKLFISDNQLYEIIGNFSIIIFVLISLYLFIEIFLKKYFKKADTIRVSSEVVYSVLKLINELLYILSVSLAIITLFILLQVNALSVFSSSNIIIKNANYFTALGIVILIIISLPFKLFFTGKKKLYEISDFLIILFSDILIFLGMIFGSLDFFDYLINW